MQNKNPLFNDEKWFVTLTYLTQCCDFESHSLTTAEHREQNRSSGQNSNHSAENQQCEKEEKKTSQEHSLFRAAGSILSALISDISFTFPIANLLLSLSVSFHSISLCSPLKDRSVERERSCLRLSYRLSQPCREKFLAIC